MTLSQQLTNNTRQLESLLSSYYDKQSWEQVYPLLVHVSSNFYDTFETNQHLVTAQLTYYQKALSYAANFANYQSILTCLLAKALGYNKIATIKLLQSSLAQLLTSSAELNLIARGKKLNQAQLSRYKSRARTTLNFLKPHFAKLPLLQTDLVQRAKGAAPYSDDSHIINLTNRLANFIAPTTKRAGLSLRNAIAQLYFKTPNQFEKQLLIELGNMFSTALPGEVIRAKGAKLIALGLIDNNRLLAYDQSEKSFRELKHYSVCEKNVRVVASTETLIALWLKLPELKPIAKTPVIDQYFNAKEMVQIKQAASFSIGKLIAKLNEKPTAIDLVLNLATRFTDNKVSELRHAIALVGIEQLPELLENQQLKQRLAVHGKLNWQRVDNRLTFFIKAVEHYKSVSAHFPCQRIINYALKYLAFTFKCYPYGVILPICKQKPKARLTDLTTLVNFYYIHKVALPEQLKKNPFYLIMQKEFDINNATDMQLACYLHLVLVNLIYTGTPLHALPPILKQGLNLAANRLSIGDLDIYLEKLVSINAQNCLI